MIFKNKDKVPLVILGFLGTCIILGLVSLHGIGISPDSVYYLSVARHIADGTGFVGYDGYFLVLQPPLYPIILAAIKILMFIDPLFSSGYVNSILFGLIIYFSGLFLLKHLRSYILVILGTISILVSFVFIQLSLMALSEPLFILLILLYSNPAIVLSNLLVQFAYCLIDTFSPLPWPPPQPSPAEQFPLHHASCRRRRRPSFYISARTPPIHHSQTGRPAQSLLCSVPAHTAPRPRPPRRRRRPSAPPPARAPTLSRPRPRQVFTPGTPKIPYTGRGPSLATAMAILNNSNLPYSRTSGLVPYQNQIPSP